MPGSRPRKRNKRKKHARHEAQTKHKQRPKYRTGGIKLQILYNLGFQIALAVLFAVFLALGFYFLKEHPDRATWMFFFSAVSVALAVTFFVQERLLYESETSGVLQPDSKPDPPLPDGCTKKYPDSWATFYGNSVNFSTGPDVTIVEIANQRLLSVRRTERGLAVSAQIFSADGRIIAQIKDNEFAINPNNYFRRERPNKSTLVIFDQQGDEVLNVHYLNSLAVRVRGIFRFQNRSPVIITNEATRIGNITIGHSCTTNTEAMITLQ